MSQQKQAKSTGLSLSSRITAEVFEMRSFPLPEYIGIGIAAVNAVVSIALSFIHSFIHSFTYSFIQTISIAPLQVHYYTEALPVTARILNRSFTSKRHMQL